MLKAKNVIMLKTYPFEKGHVKIKDSKLNYESHAIGFLGEYAWGKFTNQSVDLAIYSVRDSGEDFPETEVKTITYTGRTRIKNTD